MIVGPGHNLKIIKGRIPSRRWVQLIERCLSYLSEADFGCWHFSDLRGQADDVRCWGQNRPCAYERRLPKLTLAV
jgi:hypothetical protein